MMARKRIARRRQFPQPKKRLPATAGAPPTIEVEGKSGAASAPVPPQQPGPLHWDSSSSSDAAMHTVMARSKLTAAIHSNEQPTFGYNEQSGDPLTSRDTPLALRQAAADGSSAVGLGSTPPHNLQITPDATAGAIVEPPTPPPAHRVVVDFGAPLEWSAEIAGVSPLQAKARSPLAASAGGKATARAELTLTPGPQAADPTALHTEMLERIEALERAMTGPRKKTRGDIGHNNPPEPIEPDPLSASELREIRKALAVLKAQPPAPEIPSTKARAAVALLIKLGNRLRSLAGVTGAYLGKQADNLVTEAVKESGKRIIQSPFWWALISQLPELGRIAQHWLGSLGPH
jgi:hypothetical protein